MEESEIIHIPVVPKVCSVCGAQIWSSVGNLVFCPKCKSKWNKESK